MTLCKVYKHTLNDKVYVGQTWQILKNRTGSGRHYRTCTHFYNAIKKYGWENVKTEILALCAEQTEADFLEEFYIKDFQSWKSEYGYNLKFGGSHGRHSEETKIKMSKAKKGGVLPDEVKLKISNSLKGKVLSDEAKQKISKATQGLTKSSWKTSSYLGVSRHHNKWAARIEYKGKLMRLGRFKSEEHAAVVYDIAAKQYYGDGAKLNFIKA